LGRRRARCFASTTDAPRSVRVRRALTSGSARRADDADPGTVAHRTIDSDADPFGVAKMSILPGLDIPLKYIDVVLGNRIPRDARRGTVPPWEHLE
jgi:hypothetical protein